MARCWSTAVLSSAFAAAEPGWVSASLSASRAAEETSASTWVEALPPGGGPFGNQILPQPVPGAARGVAADGWRSGKLCDIVAGYSAVGDGETNATAALKAAPCLCRVAAVSSLQLVCGCAATSLSGSRTA